MGIQKYIKKDKEKKEGNILKKEKVRFINKK